MSQAHNPDNSTAQAAFDAQAQQWDVYSRAPLGRLRCDLTLHYLGRHLDGGAASLTILDAGAGTGNYALPLAQQGHHVCVLDFSAEMLDVARRNAQALGPDLALWREVEQKALRLYRRVHGRDPLLFEPLTTEPS